MTTHLRVCRPRVFVGYNALYYISRPRSRLKRRKRVLIDEGARNTTRYQKITRFATC